MGYMLLALAQRSNMSKEVFDELGAQAPPQAVAFQRDIGMVEDEDDGDG